MGRPVDRRASTRAQNAATRRAHGHNLDGHWLWLGDSGHSMAILCSAMYELFLEPDEAFP